MDQLFEKNVSLNQDIKRNIVSLRVSEDLFDDLHEGEASSKDIAQLVEARVKQNISSSLVSRGFHYTTGILYPFEAENYQCTRYSNGSFGCWYGAIDLDTTIYETAFHRLKDIIGTAGVTEIIYTERAIYNIHCQGILLDLRGFETQYPQLIAQEYSFTQQIGSRLANEGHPGLLAPSARKPQGVNVVAMTEKILSNARISNFLNYYLDPVHQSVRVEKTPGTTYLEIDFSTLNWF